jgi:ABC-type dipeptide/oligopeptide/nickel transport system permease component
MSRYVLLRFLAAIPILIGVTLLTFSMLHLVPGDPVQAMFFQSGASATREQMEELRERLGLKDPLPTQYWNYVIRLLQGDLGQSILSLQPVSQLIRANFPPTLELAIAAMLVGILLGITFGILAAANRSSIIDNLAMLVALAGISMPSFWLGFLLIMVFSLRLGWLPIAVGSGGALQLLLPAFTLGFQSSAIVARIVRSSLIEALNEDYIRTARAKGLSEGLVIFRHALRNALIPVVTVMGLQFGALLSGAVIVESVFARQGIGRLIVQGISSRDFPLVQGTVLFVAAIYVFVNLTVDVFYGYLDPRIRYG